MADNINDLYRKYHAGKYEGATPTIGPVTQDTDMEQGVFTDGNSVVAQDYVDAQGYREAGIQGAVGAQGPAERQVAVDTALKAIKVQKQIRKTVKQTVDRRERSYPKKVTF